MTPPNVHDDPPPEVRIDQLTGLRTILAPARAQRPIDFVNEREEAGDEDCPFCEGREDRSPPETWADRPGGGGADTPGWRVRALAIWKNDARGTSCPARTPASRATYRPTGCSPTDAAVCRAAPAGRPGARAAGTAAR